MNIRNFYAAQLEDLEKCHDGIGILKHVSLFRDSDFQTHIRFINYTILPSGASIGEHTHGDDEELYIVLEGSGLMSVEGEIKEVHAGDIVVNKPFGTHGLLNNTDHDLKILVLEVT
jgi:quercetin dioxygenase-like cupin family protein